MMRTLSNSPGRTREIGESLGRLLQRGAVVALVGELGAGKTVMAQGLAQGLGVDPDEYVSSPSFAIVNQYRGRTPIFHLDTYRLADETEMVALGYEDYFEPDGVTIIEWADKVRKLLPERYLLIEIEITGQNARELIVRPIGAWPSETAAEIRSALDSRQAESGRA